jgi:hypothetical protein
MNSEGFFVISSKQINTVHEARLMTKFDNRENLPYVFQEHHLSILPITRGKYIIGAYDAYQNIKYNNSENTYLPLPKYVESINTSDLYSESACLNCAYASGMIDDLCGEHALPTVSGRMSSDAFQFRIKNADTEKYHKIKVVNSQMEIDGGYESANALILIEAKNYSVDDFLIRQLYYPYRLWSAKIQKPVIPIFMTFSHDVFSFFVFEFQDISTYNSINLIKQKNYMIAPEPISLDDIYNILISSKIEPEPIIPFPQCNNFNRIVDLLGLLTDKNELLPEEITSNYAFVSRQTEYYTNGAKYLGLLEKTKNENNDNVFILTKLGKQIMLKHHKGKSLGIVKQILKHEVFNRVLKEYFKKSSPVTNHEITKIMENCTLYNINSISTIERRAQTVGKWIDWILELQEN